MSEAEPGTEGEAPDPGSPDPTDPSESEAPTGQTDDPRLPTGGDSVPVTSDPDIGDELADKGVPTDPENPSG